MAGKSRMHLVDGGWMTVQQAADMLGLTRRQLWTLRSRRGVSLQVAVNLYRERLVLHGGGRADRHMVDGQWTTIPEAAARLGVRCAALRQTMKRHNYTLPEAVDHYQKYQTGELARWPGRRPRTYYVNGHLLTIRQAAEKYHTTENSLRMYIFKHKCSLQTAVRQLEERRKKQAERDIMKILMGE